VKTTFADDHAKAKTPKTTFADDDNPGQGQHLVRCPAGYRCVSKVKDFLLNHDGSALQDKLTSKNKQWVNPYPLSETVETAGNGTGFYESGCPFVGAEASDGSCSSRIRGFVESESMICL